MFLIAEMLFYILLASVRNGRWFMLFPVCFVDPYSWFEEFSLCKGCYL